MTFETTIIKIVACILLQDDHNTQQDENKVPKRSPDTEAHGSAVVQW